MSPTLQDTRAQRNAALARSSSSTGHVVNVRHLADIPLARTNVRYWGVTRTSLEHPKCRLININLKPSRRLDASKRAMIFSRIVCPQIPSGNKACIEMVTASLVLLLTPVMEVEI
jgi:hypothetical protein